MSTLRRLVRAGILPSVKYPAPNSKRHGRVKLDTEVLQAYIDVHRVDNKARAYVPRPKYVSRNGLD